MASSLTSILAAEEDKILACVHCGLCLEACPTYVITGDENDGPRGRIYLMRAVAEERLAKTATAFQRHIDRCLGCRACETVCPAGVQYGQLLEAARAEILSAPARRGPGYSLMRFVLRHVWLQPARLRAAFGFSRLMRDSGVASLLLRTGLAKLISPRMEFALLLLQSSAPALPTRNANALDSVEVAVPDGAEGGKAQLFRGCVTDGLFARVNQATERVLAVNSCAVSSPDNQVCCGALHAHAGDLESARRLARQNIDAFEVGQAFLPVAVSEAKQLDAHLPIITNAGGCGAMLVSYGHLLSDDAGYRDKAVEFSKRVRDIGQQLEATGLRDGAAIGPAPITYDSSCHLLHGQHAGEASLKMLGAIPELKFTPLEGSDVCCGGAGVYNLLEEDLSGKVLAEKLKHIEESGAQVLATGNAGCHMQIAAGARLAEMDLRVCHPVELLDKSYDRAGFYESQPPAAAGD
ncbi:MAG: glycolate oxidase iron-sulfur subunit [Blastocatellia bacterium]|nr:glycolate oxidase iron-sulfur subunit [Blastocatellia bacterium]